MWNVVELLFISIKGQQWSLFTGGRTPTLLTELGLEVSIISITVAVLSVYLVASFITCCSLLSCIILSRCAKCWLKWLALKSPRMKYLYGVLAALCIDSFIRSQYATLELGGL